jgi:hypothetical protein
VAPPDETWDALFEALVRLRDRWPAQEWSYDRRMKCVVSSIPKAKVAAAEAAIADAFPLSWTAAALAAAPDGPRATAEACGGLRASQKIYWGGATLGAFGLWWPWGDGNTISLRVGLHDVDLPKERYPQLRDVFGIPQATAPGGEPA